MIVDSSSISTLIFAREGKSPMTNTQVERLQQILEEQSVLAKDYAKQQYGRKNGEDFPDVVRACLASKEFCEAVGLNALMSMMVMALTGPKEILGKLDPDKKNLGVLAQDPMINMGPLDQFWLGYQAGRQMEREESRVLNQIAEDSRDQK